MSNAHHGTGFFAWVLACFDCLDMRAAQVIRWMQRSLIGRLLGILLFCGIFIGTLAWGIALIWLQNAPPSQPEWWYSVANFLTEIIRELPDQGSNAHKLLNLDQVRAGLWVLAPMLCYSACLIILSPYIAFWKPSTLYYLGFMFTLAALFTAFGGYKANGTLNAPQVGAADQLDTLLASTGAALSTTFVGLALRYLAEPLLQLVLGHFQRRVGELGVRPMPSCPLRMLWQRNTGPTLPPGENAAADLSAADVEEDEIVPPAPPPARPHHPPPPHDTLLAQANAIIAGYPDRRLRGGD